VIIKILQSHWRVTQESQRDFCKAAVVYLVDSLTIQYVHLRESLAFVVGI
jgi:hypothetical protein